MLPWASTGPSLSLQLYSQNSPVPTALKKMFRLVQTFEQTHSEVPPFWNMNMAIMKGGRAYFFVSCVKSREGLTVCGHAWGSEQKIE